MACRTLLAREQRRMRGEYEIRLRELERERIHAEQDKAQVTASWDLHADLLAALVWSCDATTSASLATGSICT